MPEPVIRSKYRGRCVLCKGAYFPGERVYWIKDIGCAHMQCYSETAVAGYRAGYRDGFDDCRRHRNDPETEKLRQIARTTAAAIEIPAGVTRLQEFLSRVPTETISASTDAPMDQEYLEKLTGGD